jgi:hypothetical protein
MANTLLELEQANQTISKLKADNELALNIGVQAEAQNKELSKKILSLEAELVKAKDLHAADLKSAQEKISSLESQLKDFDAKVEAKAAIRAQEIAASQGIPAVPVSVAAPTPSNEEIEKKRISGLFGLEKVQAVFEAKNAKLKK